MKTIYYFLFALTVLTGSLSAQTTTQISKTATDPSASALAPVGDAASRAVNQQPAVLHGSSVAILPTPTPVLPAAAPALAIPATSMLYVIQPSDVVQISVYREPDLTSVVRLAADGSITFPLIGRVVLSGLTVQQAQDLLAQKLGDDYLVNPQVMVTIAEYTKRHFTILGQVQKPGAFDLPVDEKLTILQAVGMAGGFTRIASPSRIVVKRLTKDKKEVVIKVNVAKLANKTSDEEFFIQEGDAITVPESYF